MPAAVPARSAGTLPMAVEVKVGAASPVPMPARVKPAVSAGQLALRVQPGCRQERLLGKPPSDLWLKSVSSRHR
ncbi:hypothetical protein GCM10022235_00950 [Kribbella ginsengisoli]|uniref:Uncharacterized protein n=1 Tax=Kribbella ginsengisoli TaxID=363865 RepID=A0ABP6VNM9_9ACTN